MTAPSNIKVRIFGVNEFLSISAKNEIKKRTMIILLNTADALQLATNGIGFHVLNLGGIRAKEESKRYTKAIALRNEDMDDLKKMHAMGIDIQLQMVPRDECVYFRDIMNKEETE